MEDEALKQAKPVFLRGLENRMNMQAGFRKDFTLESLPNAAAVEIAARSFYRLYVNGQVVMNGPARTARGFLRVDMVDILPFITTGVNRLAVELTASCGCLGGYSNDVCAESSLLLADVLLDEKRSFSTDESWKALHLVQRDEYSDKISHCRQNTEIYHLDEGYVQWRTADVSAPGFDWEPAAVLAEKPRLLPRRMALPEMKKVASARLVECGQARLDPTIPVRDAWYEKDYADYYARLKDRPLYDYLRTVESPLAVSETKTFTYLANGAACDGFGKNETAYFHFDCGVLELGFIGFTFSCENDGIVDVIHLESYGVQGEKELCVGGANPVTRLYVKKGVHSFLTMEPALFRYLKFYFRGTGACSLTDIHVRTFRYPDGGMGSFQCSDDNVNRLYEAARRTLLLNTLDIFMDCPERERGGWLCDSLWTSRAAALMLGDLSVEKAFLENYMLAPQEGLPGFFPEVYPATKKPGAPTITTWSFWLMLELYEYVERSGDREFAEQYKNRIEDFVDGSGRYIGTSGLLENMPFVFVDWSLANSHTTPISTAANALYAYTLCRLGELYSREDWAEKGRRIGSVLRGFFLGTQDGDALKCPKAIEYLCDTLHLDETGRLAAGDTFSEACHYTILWTGLFTKEELPSVFKAVLRRMGPCPEFAPDPMVGGTGLFIGLCIRFDMLARLGEQEQLFREMKAVYEPQLREGPGTLWETQGPDATSRCHGFNAHAGVHLTRDLLGLDIPKVYNVKNHCALSRDAILKNMQTPSHLCALRWMRGTVKTPFGIVSRYQEL